MISKYDIDEKREWFENIITQGLLKILENRCRTTLESIPSNTSNHIEMTRLSGQYIAYTDIISAIRGLKDDSN